jgi:hypothetical protein
MTEPLLKYEFDDGSSIFIEPEVSESDQGIARASGADLVIKASSDKLKDAFKGIAQTADVIFDRLRDARYQPKEVTIELGLKFSVKGDLIILGGNVASSCKLTMKW